MTKGILVKTLVTAVLVFGSFAVRAQEATPAKESSKTHMKDKGKKKQAFINSLSEDQKASYAALKKAREDRKAAMRATFSPDQLAIVNNSELDKKGKKEALRATFTDAQKEKRKANRLANQKEKQAFVATLSEEQKALMPERKKGKGKKGNKKGE